VLASARGGATTIEGNWIGTDKNGQPQLDINGRNLLANGTGIAADGAQIGGTMSGQGNIIAYNTGPGIETGSTDVIEGNAIYGNGGPGIAVGGTGNKIEGNSIYGNARLGIDLRNDGVTANQPGGPFVGPNNYTFSGIVTEDDSGAVPMLTVGGSLQGLANTVYTINTLTLHNTAAPPYSFDVGPFNTLVTTDASGNASFSIQVVRPDLTPFINNPMGWTLIGLDATPPHFGPNYLQNYPVLASATSGSSTVVTGTLNGRANTSFTVDVYANPTEDPSGHGQGQYYLGSVPVTTDASGPTDANGKPSGNASFIYTFSTASLPAALLTAPWYISTTATDKPGNTSEFSHDLCIPVAGVTGPSDGVPGQPRTFTLSANASAVDQPAGFTYVVDWGDGTPQAPDKQTIPRTAGNGAGVAVDHVYTTLGTFTVSVTATDLDPGTSSLGTSSAVSQTISVQQVMMEGNSLAVGGTLGNDTITLSPADTTGDITVNLNGTTSFNGVTTFTPTDHILVYGQSGNDTIQLASTKIAGTTYYITVPAFIYGGGTGHEIFSVAGSTANNVVIGGGGTNQITGGLGRDLLIAGLGASKLYAGSAGAILIGGWTDYDLTSAAMTYDQKLAALEAIMAEWGSADSYTTRVNDLTNGGGLNGSYLLNTSTVHDNGQTDTLFGFPAATPLDWFFAGASDITKHKNSGEMTTTIQ
jgi:titin